MAQQLTAVPVAPGTTVQFETGDIPAYVRRNVAQIVFAEVHRYFEDPAVKADYERWKAERYARKGAAARV